MSKPKHFVGLDIGGSTIKAVIINSSAEQVGPIVEVRSHVKEGYEATFLQLETALDALTNHAGISRGDIGGIGLDVPAPSSGGVIWGKANLGDDWVGTDICGKLHERLGIPVNMTNDCNAAAVGEYSIRGNHDGALLLVAPGTGLGGGFVLPGGTLYEGANGLALEVGHVSVPFMEEDGSLPACTCGLKGCLEAWVSLVALRRRLEIELRKPAWESHMLNCPDSNIEEKAFQLRTLAEKGDALACQLFKQQGYILGYGIADVVRTLDPGLVVIGGGLAEAKFRDQYMEWIREGFTERAWSVYRHSPIEPEKITTRFEWAEGGDAAASIGMAYTARNLFS
ncbi:ROK family protein [Luteolibacter algae]|uniref:ROK family protein n=1 Tax=Luteolibacter algae TaxID=454151 RepID=A0ABW5D943_9BACT